MASQADIQWFSKAMHSEAILADAVDHGAIHRPRLWWSWTDWTTVLQYPGKTSEMRWQKGAGKTMRLVLDVPHDSLAELHPKGFRFHEKVIRREVLLPCLTTPAATDEGREAPRNLKGKLDSATRAGSSRRRLFWWTRRVAIICCRSPQKSDYIIWSPISPQAPSCVRRIAIGCSATRGILELPQRCFAFR